MNNKLSPILIKMLSSRIRAKRVAWLFSLSLAKKIEDKVSKPMIKAKYCMYSGCWPKDKALAIDWELKYISPTKKEELNSKEMKAVLKTTLLLGSIWEKRKKAVSMP